MADLQVRDVMTTVVVTVDASSTLYDATVAFAVNGISGAPVIDENGRLVGVLSETDILAFVKTLQEEILKDEKLAGVYRDISGKSVREIMSEDVLTVSPNTSVMEAIDLMIKRDVNRVPVVDHDKIVGIVTKGDIIWSLYKDKFSKT
jgi:CBS domain-containing protein